MHLPIQSSLAAQNNPETLKEIVKKILAVALDGISESGCAGGHVCYCMKFPTPYTLYPHEISDRILPKKLTNVFADTFALVSLPNQGSQDGEMIGVHPVQETQLQPV